jgi:hypothetical protein
MRLDEADFLTRLGGTLRPGSVQRATRIALAVLLILSHPVWAATIIVDETACTMVDAVASANADAAVGGCPAGSGHDTVQLATHVTLAAVHSYALGSNNGLPVVTSDITVEGGGFSIQRNAGAPAFRFFAVAPSETLTLNDVKLQNGSSFRGGAIGNYGIVILNNSTVSDNSAPENIAGAIWNRGTLALTNSTVSDNTAHSSGGAIFNEGTATLTNSTVSGNSAPFGGGIFNSNGTLTLANSTMSGNSAVYAGSVYSPAPWTATNSIIANSPSGGNCIGIANDNGNNLADDASCGAGFALITPGVDFDATLADNGGPTLTHALLPGSVAIDATGDCGLDTDQRGVPRDDGACDSGSFEVGTLDADQDGVPDHVDICLDTVIPESVPTNRLGVNRWALVDEDDLFDTTPPPGGGGGPEFEFDVADTGGCSCEQIIEMKALGWGHAKFGCSTGVMLQWTATVAGLELAQPEVETGHNAPGSIQTLMPGVDDPSSSTRSSPGEPGSRRDRSLRRSSRDSR